MIQVKRERHESSTLVSQLEINRTFSWTYKIHKVGSRNLRTVACGEKSQERNTQGEFIDKKGRRGDKWAKLEVTLRLKYFPVQWIILR